MGKRHPQSQRTDKNIPQGAGFRLPLAGYLAFAESAVGRAQPLTAPTMTPLTKYFCKNG